MRRLELIDYHNEVTDNISDGSEEEEDEKEEDEEGIEHDGVDIEASIRTSDEEYRDTDEEEEDDDDAETIPETPTSSPPDRRVVKRKRPKQKVFETEDEESDQEVSFADKKQQWRNKMKRDPHLRQLINELVDEKIEEEPTPRVKKGKISKSTDKKSKRGKIPNSFEGENILKSPSDTTLYTPVLKRGKKANNLIDRISDFVESIRLETESEDSRRRRSRDSQRADVRSRLGKRSDSRPGCSKDNYDDYSSTEEELVAKEPAREKANQLIVNAEKMKASLVAPKGNLPKEIDDNIMLMRQLDNDDDFFHISCHVDKLLKTKIEAGEFVDLERLLPREGSMGGYLAEEEPGLKIVSKGGQQYLTPQVSEKRINGIRKWDQAFRIYATIYSEANPSRASEVLQYIQIIHTAAGSYSWDNVAYYDTIFRHLMAEKPWRSWSKTYSQGWNLALKDHQVKHTPNQKSAQNDSGKVKSWKDDCCWRFNKNKCTKTDCRYDHRCTHCAGWGHSYNNCRKRLGTNRQNSTGQNGGNKSQKQTRA